jgi:hypothetical protein
MTSPVPPPLPNQVAEKLWFYANTDNQPVGPLSFGELRRLATVGTINADSYVVAEGETDWRKLKNVITPASAPPIRSASVASAARNEPSFPKKPYKRFKFAQDHPWMSICIGLTMFFLGFSFCLTIIGILIGLPTLIIGGGLAAQGVATINARKVRATGLAEKLWYYTDSANQPVGPVSFAELKQLAKKELIRHVDYVREKGATEWVRFDSICPPSFPKGKDESPVGLPRNLRSEIERELGLSVPWQKKWLVPCFYPAAFFLTRLGGRFTKQAGIAITVFLALMIVAPFVGGQQDTKESGKSFEPNLQLSISDNGKKFVVRGTTNLPDATKLHASLSTDIGDEHIELFGGEISVGSGAFETERSNPRVGALPEGEYVLKVFCSPLSQPAEVQQVLGLHGENLNGPHVVLTGTLKTFEVTQSVKVTGQNAEQARVQIADTVNGLKRKIRSLWAELESFKRDEEFLRYGFAPRGRGDWMERVEAIRDSNTSPSGRYSGACTPLISLGMEYLKSGGDDTEAVRDLRSEFLKQAGILDDRP